jgi:hypothetical protein
MNYKDILRYWCIAPAKKQRYDDWLDGSNNPFSANNIFDPDESQWQSWFAWRPVLLQDDSWRWMKQIYRRRFFAQYSRTYKWAYGDDFDYLRDSTSAL